MQFIRILLVLALVGAVAGGALWLQKTRAAQAAARSEAEIEAPEIATCKKHLKAFYVAWKQYRADHRGANPPTFESLIPKYIKNPHDLLCPTAARWQKKGRPLDQGSITIEKRTYPVTYGFRWLAAGYGHGGKGAEDRSPLIVCTSHREAMYRAEH